MSYHRYNDKAVFTLDDREYTFSPGLGCQLISYEKSRVEMGTVRYIGDRLFRLFSCTRSGWGHFQLDWALVIDDTNIDECNMAIASLRKYLEGLI